MFLVIINEKNVPHARQKEYKTSLGRRESK